MTALEVCDKIEEAINELHTETRDSVWEWSITEELPDEGHLDNLRETLRKTREQFNLGDTSPMHFVSTEGINSILAVCGNSPTAEARSRYIAWVNPDNISLLISRLRELEGQQKISGGEL